MNRLLSALVMLMLALITIGGCLRYKTSGPSVSNTSAPRNDRKERSSPTPVESNSGQENRAQLTISSMALYGWWWSEEQLENNFDADNPPPKKAYVKLDKWDASQPDSAHPDRIDIICRLENHTKESIDVSLEAFADFKVGSYQAIARGSGTEEAVDEKLRQIEWSDNQEIGRPVTGTLRPDEARDVKFKDFDLRAVIDKYLKPSAGDRWPWRLRISIIAKNSKRVRVAHGEATIDLIPGD